MELWRPEVMEGRRPDVLSTRTFVVALVLHLVVFAVFWIVAAANGLFAKKEAIIPIDLTVIVNENLDGVENEPPPVLNPPPPEPPKPKTRKPDPPKPKKVEPPKPLEQIETNIVKKVEKDKKKDPPKPETPKKTAKELREEKMKRIRDKAKVNNKPVKIEVKGATKSGNGKTGRQTMSEAEIRKLLDQGYRPGTQNQLASNEKQRCISLIQMAIEEKWDALLPKVGRNGTVLLSVQFNSAGGLINVKLAKSCGDPLSDQAALTVARAVTSIRGLSADFIAEFRKEPLKIRYNVQRR